MDFLRSALAALPQAATNPLALVGYVVLIIAWVVIGLRVKRNKQLLGSLDKLPKGDRLKALQLEMGAVRIRSRLTPEQWIRSRVHLYYFLGFAIVALVVVLIFTIAAMTGGGPSSAAKPSIVLVDSYSRQQVLEELEHELQHVATIDWDPIKSDWLGEASTIAKRTPRVVVVHFHALRDLGGRTHFRSEEDLLLGLSRIRTQSPDTRFVIFSSGFAGSDPAANMVEIRRAKERLVARARDSLVSADLDALLPRVSTASWSEQPSDEDRAAMSAVVRAQLERGSR